VVNKNHVGTVQNLRGNKIPSVRIFAGNRNQLDKTSVVSG
jgi:hypothetical protein